MNRGTSFARGALLSEVSMSQIAEVQDDQYTRDPRQYRRTLQEGGAPDTEPAIDEAPKLPKKAKK